VQSLSLGVSARGQGGFGSWVLQGMQDVLEAAKDDIGGGTVWELDLAGEPS
jgi:hypothetical protein